MRWLFVTLIVVHGLIHLMGSAKAFGLAELPQLSLPISRGMGAAWLVAGVTMLLTAAAFVWLPRSWWLIGLVAVVLSQFLILSAWSDAKVGTVANVLILIGIVYNIAAR